MITVDLHLHPLAWHVLRRECGTTPDGTVKMYLSRYHPLLVAMLERRLITPAEYITKPVKGREGKVFIYDNDFYRRGCYLRPNRQEWLSRIITEDEKHRLCLFTAAIYSTGLPRDTAMRYFIEKEDYEQDELNFPQLKKYYQRNYSDNEKELFADRQNIKKLMCEMSLTQK